MTPPDRDAIRKYLRKQAGWVWSRQGAAAKLGLTIQEETLTEMILLRIATDFSRHGLKVRMFTRAQENRNGADWEWTFTSRRCSIALRVQAKRLYMTGRKRGRYGGWTTSGLQARKLITDAGTDFFPVFVFYNNFATHVFNCRPPDAFHGPSRWGCSFANAQDVLKSHSDLPKDLVGCMRPWHQLFDVCKDPRVIQGNRRRGRGVGAVDGQVAVRQPPMPPAPFEPSDEMDAYLEQHGLTGVAHFDATDADIEF